MFGKQLQNAYDSMMKNAGKLNDRETMIRLSNGLTDAAINLAETKLKMYRTAVRNADNDTNIITGPIKRTAVVGIRLYVDRMDKVDAQMQEQYEQVGYVDIELVVIRNLMLVFGVPFTIAALPFQS